MEESSRSKKCRVSACNFVFGKISPQPASLLIVRQAKHLARRILRSNTVGVVALELVGVDFDFSDRAGQPELQDDPIVSGTAAAFCFPPVAHVLGATGHDQIVHRTEKHVATGERHSAIFDGREIDQFAWFQLAPVGDNYAVDAKTRYAAVRE